MFLLFIYLFNKQDTAKHRQAISAPSAPLWPHSNNSHDDIAFQHPSGAGVHPTDTVLFVGSAKTSSLQRSTSNPPVILSPPPVPDRAPTFDKIWFKSATPRGSPRCSPHHSPSISPSHTPQSSPKSKQKNMSDMSGKPQKPKPYDGNSSLLRCAHSLDKEIPPVPIRKRELLSQPDHLFLSKSSNRHSFTENDDFQLNESILKQTSSLRRVKSNDALDRSVDFDDKGSSLPINRANNIEFNAKHYNPIFNPDTFLFPKSNHIEPNAALCFSNLCFNSQMIFDPPTKQLTQSTAISRTAPNIPLPSPPEFESDDVTKFPSLPPKFSKQTFDGSLNDELISVRNFSDPLEDKFLAQKTLNAPLTLYGCSSEDFSQVLNESMKLNESKTPFYTDVIVKPIDTLIDINQEVLPDSKEFSSHDVKALYNVPTKTISTGNSAVHELIPGHSQISRALVSDDDDDDDDDLILDVPPSTQFDNEGHPPPVPPHRRGNNVVNELSSSAHNESINTIHECNNLKFGIKNEDRDFQSLISQGYSPEAIKKALMVSGNNYNIARNILKEFAPVKKH